MHEWWKPGLILSKALRTFCNAYTSSQDHPAKRQKAEGKIKHDSVDDIVVLEFLKKFQKYHMPKFKLHCHPPSRNRQKQAVTQW